MVEDQGASQEDGRDYAAELDMGDQERQRLSKLQALREMGIDPYPPRSHRTHTTAEAVAAFVKWEPQASDKESEGQDPSPQGVQTPNPDRQPPQVVVVGRLRLRRTAGKVTFAHIEDESGRLQLYFRINDLQDPPWDYEAVNKLLDL